MTPDDRMQLRRYRFKYLLKRRYGITVQDYAWMWHAQNGLCAICEKPLELDRLKGVHVDHKHGRRKKGEPLKVRGLLHNYCNLRYLGQVERGGETRLRNVARYLGWSA